LQLQLLGFSFDFSKILLKLFICWLWMPSMDQYGLISFSTVFICWLSCQSPECYCTKCVPQFTTSVPIFVIRIFVQIGKMDQPRQIVCSVFEVSISCSYLSSSGRQTRAQRWPPVVRFLGRRWGDFRLPGMWLGAPFFRFLFLTVLLRSSCSCRVCPNWSQVSVSRLQRIISRFSQLIPGSWSWCSIRRLEPLTPGHVSSLAPCASSVFLYYFSCIFLRWVWYEWNMNFPDLVLHGRNDN
jgi:hypothetical protein